MNAAACGQDRGTSGCESESNQSVAGDFQRGLAVWRNFHDPTLAGKRCRHVEIAFRIERKSLGTPQAAVESGHVALRVDLVDAIET